MQGDFRVDQGKVMWDGHMLCAYSAFDPDLEIQYLVFLPLQWGARWGQGPMKETGNILRSDFGGTTPQLRVISKKYTFLVIMRRIWITNEKDKDGKDKIEFEGDRPVIFSARHSHANYSTPYQHGGWGGTDKANRDVKWETWKIGGGLEFLEDNPASEVDHLWNRFNGNWGGSKSMVSTPGIRGIHGWDAD